MADFFAPETLIDRGQLNAAEYEALGAYGELKQFDRSPLYKEKHPEQFKECKSIYEESGFNFDRWVPLNLGWKTQWLAVKTTNVLELIYRLTTRHMIEQKEEPASTPSSHFIEMTKDKYLYVMQPCNGIVFIQSQLLRSLISKNRGAVHYKDVLEGLPHSWGDISEDFGEVFLFWSQRNIMDHGFICWRNGGVVRAVSSSQNDDYAAYGAEIDGETYGEHLDMNGLPRKYLYQDHIFYMADKCGANNNRIMPLRPGEKAYCWFVDE